MKKIKRLLILIALLVAFGMLHCYTEQKFSDAPTEGMTERIEGWLEQFNVDEP